MSPDESRSADDFLQELAEQVADRFIRFARTSTLATSEAASAAGRDLATWLLRQVRGLGGEATTAVASELPPRPWVDATPPGSWFIAARSRDAAIIVWTSVVVSPVPVRRVFLEDLRRALDQSRPDYVTLGEEAREMLSAQRDRLEAGLAKDGVSIAEELPTALEDVTVASNWVQNDLTRDLFEREARHVTDVDGYDWIISESQAAARRGVTSSAASQPLETGASATSEEASADAHRLREVARALGITKGRTSRKKGDPADSFAASTAQAFRNSVREARRIRT